MNANLMSRVLLVLVAVLTAGLLVGGVLADTEKAKEHYNLGIQEKQAGKTDAALLAFKAAIAVDAEYVDAYKQLGTMYFAQKDYPQAAQYATTATEKAPQDAEGFTILGSALVKLSKYGEAETALKKAIAIDAGNVTANKELCKALYYSSKYEDVIGAATKLHAAGGGDDFTYFVLGKAYQKTKQDAKAIEALGQSTSLNADNYNAHSTLGAIYLSQQKFKSSAAAYKAAMTADPKKYQASYNYAVAVQSSDPTGYAKSIEVWQGFIKAHKKNPKAKTKIAEAESIVKELKKAAEQSDLQ